MENKLNYVMKSFSSVGDLPRCTENGFKVVRCPHETWNIIKEVYQLLKSSNQAEYFNGIEDLINGENRPELLSLDPIPYLRRLIHNNLLEIHEKWSNQELSPTFIYGIRSYLKDSTLKSHTDRIATHHISAIIIVDKDLDGQEDWPLDIQDHAGNWHKVYAQPGDMILYESAICEHGRLEPFKGNFFRNFYVHYKFKNYHYAGQQ